MDGEWYEVAVRETAAENPISMHCNARAQYIYVWNLFKPKSLFNKLGQAHHMHTPKHKVLFQAKDRLLSSET